MTLTQLEDARRVYRMWGLHPFLYKLGTAFTFLGQESKLRGLAVARLNLKSGDVVLDLGCGTGLNFPYLEKYIGSAGKIIAFDLSKDMLSAAKKQAEKNGWDNIEFIQGDAAELNLPEKVEGVLSTLAVSVMPNHKEALRRAIAVLKSGRNISILDAQFPSGIWGFLNPLIALVYKKLTAWDHTKDIPGDFQKIIPNAKKEEYNEGMMYILYTTKP